ncbi:head-specific guanylate cyclase-like isoform X3 [Artemia franciscana]|uniref:head-specific guanylate cyclase-like isoform X3 n=1 Tax=Artemia franciscana TaxID=6661 RepID=UPI0032DA26BD
MSCPFRSKSEENIVEEKEANIGELNEAISSLILLPFSEVREALQTLFYDIDSGGADEDLQRFISLSPDLRLCLKLDESNFLLENMFLRLQHLKGKQKADEFRVVLEALGEKLLVACLTKFSGTLRNFAPNLQDFLTGLGSVFAELRISNNTKDYHRTSFSCVRDPERILLHYGTNTPTAGYIFAGVLKGIAKNLFRCSLSMQVTLHELSSLESKRYHFGYKIKTVPMQNREWGTERFSSKTFCSAFPWHLVLDRKLKIVELGAGFLKLFGRSIRLYESDFVTYLEIRKPHVNPTSFAKIVKKINSPFILRCRRTANTSDTHENQDGLKRRMDKLRRSVEEASTAVDEERRKNVSLLHMIFPPDIARTLWQGQAVEAQTHSEVTLLFSDIVGFTAICSEATPMQVVEMLQSLYTCFDKLCGFLDVYKVETIGDAYCVAAGLHRPSATHAQQVCWMALRIVESCRDHQTPDGQPIKMRVGIHSGTVIAGVVGRQMPRYCLFGHTVALAAKFESSSEAWRVHISPATFKYIKNDGFVFKERSRECLPKDYPSSDKDCSYFLLDYLYPRKSKLSRLKGLDDISLAVEELGIGDGSK